MNVGNGATESLFVEVIFLRSVWPNGGRTSETWNAPIRSPSMDYPRKAANKRYYNVKSNQALCIFIFESHAYEIVKYVERSG